MLKYSKIALNLIVLTFEMKPTNIDFELMKALKTARISKSLKQINVANSIGVSESYYCKIENGQKTISIGKFIAICKYLEISSLQLFAIMESDVTISKEE